MFMEQDKCCKNGFYSCFLPIEAFFPRSIHCFISAPKAPTPPSIYWPRSWPLQALCRWAEQWRGHGSTARWRGVPQPPRLTASTISSCKITYLHQGFLYPPLLPPQIPHYLTHFSTTQGNSTPHYQVLVHLVAAELNLIIVCWAPERRGAIC